jgi:hypothetical protein
VTPGFTSTALNGFRSGGKTGSRRQKYWLSGHFWGRMEKLVSFPVLLTENDLIIALLWISKVYL